MAESEGVSLGDFRVLVGRAGLNMTDEELESLKPMYDHYIRETARLHELELDAEDMAVAFSPVWDTRG